MQPSIFEVAVGESAMLVLEVTHAREACSQGGFDGSGRQSCKCNYVDITKMPGPHADTARVMPGRAPMLTLLKQFV